MECKECGKPIAYRRIGAPRKFCDAKCRRKYEYKALRVELLKKAKDAYWNDPEKFRTRKRMEAARKPLSELSEGECGYIAGLIDGEGTISMFRVKFGKGVQYRPYMLIVNTDMKMLEGVRKMLGTGEVTKHTDKRSRGSFNSVKPVYKYLGSPSVVRRLLPQIRPYLITKARQADIVMEAAAVNFRQQGIPHTPEFIETMERAVKELRGLHGKKYVPLTRVPAE